MSEWEDHLAKFTEKNGFYIPKDPSDNTLRHFGVRRGNVLYLHHLEVLYLFSSKPPSDSTPETKAYFDLKNSGYNILFDNGCALFDSECYVYQRTHHFNRLKEETIGKLAIRNKDEIVEFPNDKEIVGVVGEDSLCYLKVERLEDISQETTIDLVKTQSFT